ncbi:dihydrodipicolinate reductase [Chloroflexota bacterium]
MSKKVVVWGTGWIAKIAVRTIHDRPDLELIGVWVHSEPGRDGTDAGLLIGDKPIGVQITNDAERLIGLKPDCILYALNPPKADAVNLPWYERFLEAGINVVSTSGANWMFPPACNQDAVKRLEAVAIKGGASFYVSGLEPGFAADHLALTLLTLSNTVKSVRTSEIFCYDTSPDEWTQRMFFGFGQTLEYAPILMRPGVQSRSWGPPIHMVAAAMGVKIEKIRETYDRKLTNRDLEVACGTIKAGTVGAVRFETIGVVNGRDTIIIEHVNRMAPDIAPEWPTAAKDGTYRIIVEGDPSFRMDLSIGANSLTAGQEGMIATAMRVVNAINAICDAKPGLKTALDLPMTLPTSAFRSTMTHAEME